MKKRAAKRTHVQRVLISSDQLVMAVGEYLVKHQLCFLPSNHSWSVQWDIGSDKRPVVTVLVKVTDQ